MMRPNPHLLELNAFVFLTRLSKKYGKPLALLTIPEAEWKLFADQGFDMIWLMGVWRRSPAARAQALRQFHEHGAYRNVLPDIQEQDIAGSAYAIYDYTLDPFLGNPGDLASLKRKLNGLGLKLILDFVPNHLALDHPWTAGHPDRFVQGNSTCEKEHPDRFFKTPGNKAVLAHGRDPYFSPWADTVQINFFSANTRRALIDEMLKIAEACDGVRCDMAMLALNSIFRDVWKGCHHKDHEPKSEFWEELIKKVKVRFPDFLLMAEVYWDLEERLQDLGFDYTYDKLFYDKLRHAPAHEIYEHLKKPQEYLKQSVHFTENHDETRAVTAFGRERSLAAAAIVATTPGLRFFHDGQARGEKIHVPVQIRREPGEPGDREAAEFYGRLFDFAKDEVLHSGEWRLLDIKAVDHHVGIESSNLLAWEWEKAREKRIVLINYGAYACEGKIQLAHAAQHEMTGELVFQDTMSGKKIHATVRKPAAYQLHVRLPAWGVKLLST